MVTESRRRVLLEYRRQREKGKPPVQAMLDTHYEAMREQHLAYHSGDEARIARAEWDIFYAKRYYQSILFRGLYAPYWTRTLVVD